MQGLSKQQFSVHSREMVELADVELILKDLIRKQQQLKELDQSLAPNSFVGFLHKKTSNLEETAQLFMQRLQLDRNALSQAKNSVSAFKLLSAALEKNQVLVGQSVQNFMPQRISVQNFSGMTVSDKKLPYIFISGGDKGDNQEPNGRKLFTLVLLSVLVARKIFAPVSYDATSTGAKDVYEFDLTGTILMPQESLKSVDGNQLSSVKQIAKELNVTPSALTVRLQRLGYVPNSVAVQHLTQLKSEYSRRQTTQMRPPKPANAIAKYNGAFMTERMLNQLDARKITPRDFRRTICLNNLPINELSSLRESVWNLRL